jgi:trigger factor
MKKAKLRLVPCIMLIIALAMLAGCNAQQPSPELSNSEGIDDNGFWRDIRALDYVEIFNYRAMPIPSDVHTVSDAAIQNEISSILAELDYVFTKQITDRPVADGDLVNIDYVGSVDGVAFSGGSTGGLGADVTAGSREYIDDFLSQIIGHMPGETINVEVTFPVDYGPEDLNGKDAVFVTTINYIIVNDTSELTDDFVLEELSLSYGWTTVEEMTGNIRADLQKSAIQQYIQDYFLDEVVVASIPDRLIQHQEDSMLEWYQGYADEYEMELDDFLNNYVGYENTAELITDNQLSNMESARFYLVSQAVAEDMGAVVSDEDVEEYFGEYYASYEEQYGLPYMKQMTLINKVFNYIFDNAVLS